jgi:hypothetical protein
MPQQAQWMEETRPQPQEDDCRMTKSCAHGGTRLRPLCVSTDAPRSTAERWCDVATPRTDGAKVAQLQLA